MNDEDSELENLQVKRIHTLTEVERIEAQLGNRDMHHPNGQRMTKLEWNSWRIKAKTALANARKELRIINLQIARVRRERGPSGLHPNPHPEVGNQRMPGGDGG